MISQIEVNEKFENKFWRLNNLYWIIDKAGQKVPFRLNWAQEKLFDDLWYMNVLLKARQFGGTTFVDLYFLDECVFNDHIEAGIIAHNREDAAKIFRRKVQFPYRNLPEGIRNVRYPTTDSQQELAFNNNSTIYVGTSMRSGTLQYLHISEHGKICRKYPEKAEEIKTGSLNAVEAGQMVIIESTAEGATGDFYDFCRIAMNNQGRELSAMDWKFHFFPWFWNPEYSIDPSGITIPDDITSYFNNLERSLNIELTQGQRAWYTKKADMMGIYMKREYPSTPEEAFEGASRMFSFSKDHHVIQPMPIPKGAQLYFTYDWGFGAPFSIGYWWVDGDGRLYRFSEIYGQDTTEGMYGKNIGLRKTDDEVSELVLRHEETLAKQFGIDFKHIIRLAGPDCFSKKPDYRGGGQGPSTAETMSAHGIYLTPGDPSRELKIRQFHQRLRLFDDMPPMMLIYNNCTEFIRTIPLIQADDKNIEYVDTSMEVHVFDESCHVCMARPLSLADKKGAAKPMADRILDLLEKGPRDDEAWHEDATRKMEHDWDLMTGEFADDPYLM